MSNLFLDKEYTKRVFFQISNIFLVSLCRSDDIKTQEVDFNDLWQMIVRDVSLLENDGIKLDNNTTINGTVIYLGHDNLGANSSIGMVESFGATNFCRFCHASKKETEVMLAEDLSMLRTMVDYEHSLELIAKSTKVDYKQTKGVKRPCALNQLKYFHILQNKSVDIMHDLNEGAIPFLLKHVFSYCITEKIFNEDWLRKKIQFYDFGYSKKNAPSILMLTKHNLNQNASQMMCLFKNIGFILIQFRADPRLQTVWKFVNALQTVVQIAYSSDIREKDLIDFSDNTHTLLEGMRIHI